MKKIIPLTLATLAVLTAPLARAWTYNDGDALLVFRASGFNDVEFDLGNISQFTNVASGTTITVSGWNANLVTSTFGTDLTGVSVIVAATTSATDASPAAWLSSGDASAVAYQFTPSQWQSRLWGVINSIGTRPVIYQITTAGTNSYSIDPGSSSKLAAYDQIVSGNGQNSTAIAQFGGNAAFTVEGVTPASFGLWKISPSTTIPKPVATYVGTFQITSAGGLTFTAGAPKPSVLGITRSNGVNTVSFTTSVGGSYWLTYTNKLAGASTNWPVVSGPLTGDGNNNSLTHAIADSAGFYGVKRTD